MRFQVVLALTQDLREAREQHGVKGLAHDLGMTPSYVRGLINGAWSEITRDQLQRLVAWARQRQPDSDPRLFHSLPHPLWETFSNAAAKVLVPNSLKTVDLQSLGVVQAFLERDGCTVAHMPLMKPATPAERKHVIEQVTDTVRNHNCVVVSGPGINSASEVVSALLWNATPFDPSPRNRKKIPFLLNYYAPDAEVQESAVVALASPPSKRGVVIDRKYDLRFPFQPRSTWIQKLKEPTFDFAVVIACRKPLGTEKPVSTLVVMGLTGFATKAACESIAKQYLHIDKLDDNVPQLLVYCARFNKGPGEDGRRLTEGCRWVRSPWDYWPQRAVRRRRKDRGSRKKK
jgi:hypothetical protein